MPDKATFSDASRRVREDPESAQAHLQLADEFLALGTGEGERSEGALRMGLTEARRACSLDPNSLPAIQTKLTLAAHLGELETEMTALAHRAKENPGDEIARQGLKAAEGLLNAGMVRGKAQGSKGLPEIAKTLLFALGEFLVVVVLLGMADFNERDLFLLALVAILFLWIAIRKMGDIRRANPLA